MDFVCTLLNFSMELTKVCVELVWRLCFGVEFVWILNFGFIPTFGVILGLIVGWFYVVFVACFVASIGRILWPVDKGCSGMVSGQKMACTEAVKELSGTPMHGSHAIAWLGSNFQPSGMQLRGFPRNCIAPASSGTLLRGFPRNCVAPAHFQTYNFGRP